MAKKRGSMGGGKGGPGSVVISFLIILVAAGAVFAFAKANNITSASAFFDWSRETSVKLKGCMQPEIDFWTCSNPFSGGTGGTGSGNGSTTPPAIGGNGNGGGSTGGSSNGGGSDPSTPAQPSGNGTLQTLSTIKIGDPMKVDYDRGQWKHWIGGRCDDTRQQVLREQAISFQKDAEGCKVVSGEWIDPYTGEKFTDPSKLDIDHVYALGAAAKNGGNDWDAAKKEQFANDKSHLLAVSASANRSKSDKNPSQWWPDNGDYSCQFATKYVDVAAKYGLQFSKADVSALEKGLKTCG